uniref:Trichohyalin-plectin-homology domain-containing protein n=2 Tax=Chrysotila carterae TaxID=13221 RepID=A0A7S4F602_CHRCT
MLAAYEQELRDSSEFDAWQARMRAEDEEQRLAEVERRRIETLLADEEAKEARLRAVNEKRAIAGAMKLESDANAVKREQEAEAMRLQQKALVLDVQAQRERPAQAAEEMVRQNHLKAKELREEKEALEERAAAEAAAEAERRADLIRQIRALELVPKVRVKTVDPTYTPQHGLLEEMSLAELRERLNSVELERQREEEAKRNDIISAKKERDDDLRRRMERLSAMRELSAQQATSKRELAKRAQKEAEAQRQGRLAEAQMKVNAQMEAKRAARAREEARLAEELKQIKLKKAFLDADKEAVERSKFESLQGGARRELIARQETGIKNATNAAKIHDKETAQRLLNLQQEREIHEAFLRDYERRASEHQYDSNIAEDTLQASRQMLKARLGLGVKTGLPTSSSWMQNTRQPLQNTGRPFDDTLQQTAPRVRTAEN